MKTEPEIWLRTEPAVHNVALSSLGTDQRIKKNIYIIVDRRWQCGWAHIEKLIELAKCTGQTHYIVTTTRANLNRSEHYSIHLASVRPPLLRSESWEVLEPKAAVLGRRQCTPRTSHRENIQTPHRKAAGTTLQPFCCKGDSVNRRLALHPQTTILRM